MSCLLSLHLTCPWPKCIQNFSKYAQLVSCSCYAYICGNVVYKIAHSHLQYIRFTLVITPGDEGKICDQLLKEQFGYPYLTCSWAGVSFQLNIAWASVIFSAMWCLYTIYILQSSSSATLICSKITNCKSDVVKRSWLTSHACWLSVSTHFVMATVN